MKFIKGLAGIITATALLVNTTIVDAATWAYSNLNASETVVAYSADYPAQTAAAALIGTASQEQPSLPLRIIRLMQRSQSKRRIPQLETPIQTWR